MGEAKKRLRLSERIRREQPLCIFCGGTAPSETLEHYPPRILFDGKQRPAGLEFGACKQCNEGSRTADHVVAVLARMMPNSSSEAAREETHRLIARAVKIPGFTQELQIEPDPMAVLHRFGSKAYSLPSWSFMRINDGPVIHGSMRVFGAKLGLALHFVHAGRIVPEEGGVEVIWYSNAQAYSGDIPEDFIRMFGPGKTLRQGRREVSTQFRASSLIAEDGALSAHVAVFRESFAILMFVAEDIAQMEHAQDPVRPGFLRKTGNSNARGGT